MQYLFANVAGLIPIAIIIVVAIAFTILLRFYILDAIKELSTRKRDIELIDRLIHERKSSVIKRKKVFKVVKNVAFYIFLALLIPVLGYAVLMKIKGTSPQIGNTTVMVVGSGSMSFKNKANDYLFNQSDKIFDYQFKRGDIIFLKKIDSDNDIGQYSVICYYDSVQGKNIIHRIREVNSKDGIINYTTRGDANNADDEVFPTIKDIVGKYEGHKIILVGNLILFLQNKIGIATFISLIYLLVMIDYFLKKLAAEEKIKKDAFASLIGYENDELHYVVDNVDQPFETITIKYLGVTYQFNQAGLIKKQTTENKLIKDDLKMLKIIQTENGEVTLELTPPNNLEKGK